MKVKERQQKEASAYPSEQLGVASSLSARHGVDGRASNWRWHGVGGVAAGCGDVAWSAVALLPGRDGRWVAPTDQAPDVRDQGCDWRWWHADRGRARPQRGASQASLRMAGQIAKPLTGCVALVHLQDAIPAVSRLLAGSSAAPNALGCSSPRGSTCSIPAPVALCLFLWIAIQCSAVRCDAMLCGVIGMRAGRCLAGQVLVFSGVAQCLKQSGSRSLLARMATSWGSFVVVATSPVRLVGLSGFVRGNSSIRQHRVEKHS